MPTNIYTIIDALKTVIEAITFEAAYNDPVDFAYVDTPDDVFAPEYAAQDRQYHLQLADSVIARATTSTTIFHTDTVNILVEYNVENDMLAAEKKVGHDVEKLVSALELQDNIATIGAFSGAVTGAIIEHVSDGKRYRTIVLTINYQLTYEYSNT